MAGGDPIVVMEGQPLNTGYMGCSMGFSGEKRLKMCFWSPIHFLAQQPVSTGVLLFLRSCCLPEDLDYNSHLPSTIMVRGHLLGGLCSQISGEHWRLVRTILLSMVCSFPFSHQSRVISAVVRMPSGNAGTRKLSPGERSVRR